MVVGLADGETVPLLTGLNDGKYVGQSFLGVCSERATRERERERVKTIVVST